MQRATIFIFMFKWHHQWTYLCDLKIIMKREKVQIPHFFLNLSLNFDLFFLPPWVWVPNPERRIVKTTMPKFYDGIWGILPTGLVPPPPPKKKGEMEYYVSRRYHFFTISMLGISLVELWTNLFWRQIKSSAISKAREKVILFTQSSV